MVNLNVVVLEKTAFYSYVHLFKIANRKMTNNVGPPLMLCHPLSEHLQSSRM